MPVEITDWHVRLVRAFVTQDVEALKPMLSHIPKSDEPDGTVLMLRAAFFEACRRRFDGGTRADVIRFVSHARIRRGSNAPPIDPAAAEKLVMEVLTGAPAEGLTDMEKSLYILLLGELIEDENPTWDQLDAYLESARTRAERIAATL